MLVCLDCDAFLRASGHGHAHGIGSKIKLLFAAVSATLGDISFPHFPQALG
jgi:hypothetical protein